MYSLLGSESKEKIITYLSRNPNKKAKDISVSTGLGYKNTSKILKILEEKRIITKESGTYCLKGEFIDFLKHLSNIMVENYSEEFLLKNNLDVYNTISELYPKDAIKKKINEMITKWTDKKLDEWYSKFYDPKNKEYEKLREIIKSKFGSKRIKILEIGCGTGRITKKLENDFNDITAVDKNWRYTQYCKKNLRKTKIITSDIIDFNEGEKFDVIIFSWTGLHYQKNQEEIMEKIKKIVNKRFLIVILDAYYDTEYIKILQMLRNTDMDNVKLSKERLNELLVREFGKIKQEVLLTEYRFDSMESLINNFKIELTLEESRVWTKRGEDNLREYLSQKKNPLIVQEGLWITTIDNLLNGG